LQLVAVPHTTHILAQPLCSPEDIQRTCVRLSRAHACPRPCRPAGRPGAQPARARRCCGPRRRGCCKRRRRRARRGRRRRGACSRTGPARAGCGAAAAGLCAGAGAPRRPPMRCLHSRQPEQAHVPGLYTSVDDARAPGHCVLVGWCGCPQLSLPRDHRRLASSRHPCWLPAAARIAMRVGLGHCSNASLLTADTHISVRSGCCRLLLQTAAAAAAACFPPACSVSIYTPCATCAHKCASRRPQEPPCRPIHACSVQGGLALCAYVQSGDPEAEALEALGEVAGLDGLAADQASASAPGQQLSSKS